MTRNAPLLLSVVICMFAPAAADARGHSGAHYSTSHSYRSSGGTHHSSTFSGGYTQSGSHHSSSSHTYGTRSHSGSSLWTSHGKHKRDPAQRQAFMRQHPCPSTGKSSGACPGYVVDHVTPLKRGGADSPSDMQLQTKAAAKAKDKWE